jgi:hypothetical protein
MKNLASVEGLCSLSHNPSATKVTGIPMSINKQPPTALS